MHFCHQELMLIALALDPVMGLVVQNWFLNLVHRLKPHRCTR